MRFETLVFAGLIILTGCSDGGTYAAQCSAPLTHWRKQSEGMNHHAIPNYVRLDGDGRLSWNGASIDEAALASYMDQARPMIPLPFLILSADVDAPCASVRRIRALMDERYCKIPRVCGEGRGKWQAVMDLPGPEELKRVGAEADNALEAAGNSSR